jgi:hypothetical protein
MCKCTERPTFQTKLKEAYDLKLRKGVPYAVWGYAEDNLNIVYLGEESIAKSRLEAGKICCYHLPRLVGDKIMPFEVERPKIANKISKQPKDITPLDIETQAK